MRTISTRCIVVTIALLLLTGCSAKPQAVTLVNSCELLTQADVQTLYGLTVAPPRQSASGDPPTANSSTGYVSTCNYHTEGDLFKQAGVLAHQSYSHEMALQTMAQAQEEVKKAGNITETVTGVGDAAYWDSSFNQLGVVKGTVWYIITADAKDGMSVRDTILQVAQTILQRAPE